MNNTSLRIDKTELLDLIGEWDKYVKGKVHLVACGGTALTLQDLKPSTKDVDFMIPDIKQYAAFVRMLKSLGYRMASGSGWSRDTRIIVDLYTQNKIHTTELLESPLEEGNHSVLMKLKRLTVSVLNDYDLVISKVFRASSVDYEDCELLIRSRGGRFDFNILKERYKETASYDINPKRMMSQLDGLLVRLGKA